MLMPRVIPSLLLKDNGLYKTKNFSNPSYIGDPVNVVKIFNEKEVDEIVILDISASLENKEPNFKLLAEIAGEAFMPLAYGGGIRTVEDARQIFSMGYEKVVLNTIAFEDMSIIERLANEFGSQSIVVSVDIKRNLLRQAKVYSMSGNKKTSYSPLEAVKKLEGKGVGEILLNFIDRDGCMNGYDLSLVKEVTSIVNVPVAVCGGAGSLQDLVSVVNEGGASAAVAGSLFVYYGPHKAVLMNYPKYDEILRMFSE